MTIHPATPEDSGHVYGEELLLLAKRLFPLNRSLTGSGNRQTLKIIKEFLPDLELHSIPSRTQVFDWEVPDEWHVRSAFIEDDNGDRIVDFAENNLHLVGYSTPIDRTLSLSELQSHLYSLPENPDAIPYVTSYYEPRWGFCISDRMRKQLTDGRYRVVIDSEIVPGQMDFADFLIPGDREEEILLSTYICHPSMANNEASGMAVTTLLGRELLKKKRKFSYRIVFVPETIGSIAYIHTHLEQLKSRTIAGFIVTCVGDDRCYSYLASRKGNTLADRVAKLALREIDPDFHEYSYLHRGSDERQYCSPGVDLPVVSVMRSKYHEYPEYHTSLDDFRLVTERGLSGGFNAIWRCLDILESNCRVSAANLCEPKLGKRGLFPTLSTLDSSRTGKRGPLSILDVLAYCDGDHCLMDIAELLGRPYNTVREAVQLLLQHQLVTQEDNRGVPGPNSLSRH